MPATRSRHEAARPHSGGSNVRTKYTGPLLCLIDRAGPGARLRSLMAENGVIFSDGVEADRLDFNAGAEVAIGIAEQRGRLIV